MSILKGTMSYSSFSIKSEAPLAPEAILEKLRLFKFKALHPHGEDSEAWGWCPYQAEYDLDKSIEIRDFLYDDKIVLSMRVDVISLPKELLKSNIKKSIKSYYQDHKKWPDKVIKKEIEKAEMKALRARVLPKTKIIEAMWDQKQGRLRVFCRAQKQLDQFNDLFAQTFLSRPLPKDFSGLALQHKEAIEALSFQPLFAMPQPVDVQ